MKHSRKERRESGQRAENWQTEVKTQRLQLESSADALMLTEHFAGWQKTYPACWLVDCVKVLSPTLRRIGHFRDLASQPLGLVLEKLKSKQHRNKMIKANTTKHEMLSTTRNLNLNRRADLRTVHTCAYHCAQLSYTTQHRTVLIIFPHNLQTIIRAQMPRIGGEGVFMVKQARLYKSEKEGHHRELHFNDCFQEPKSAFSCLVYFLNFV